MIRQRTVVYTNPDNESDKQVLTSLVQTNYRLSRPPGHSPRLPNGGKPQQLTDKRFMTASQKRAFDKGEEIWV